MTVYKGNKLIIIKKINNNNNSNNNRNNNKWHTQHDRYLHTCKFMGIVKILIPISAGTVTKM
jgi:membrane protein DedA with SNARE-associated domain